MPLVLVAVLLGLVSCATTTFTALPPQGDGIYQGKGGTKSVVDGMRAGHRGRDFVPLRAEFPVLYINWRKPTDDHGADRCVGQSRLQGP